MGKRDVKEEVLVCKNCGKVDIIETHCQECYKACCQWCCNYYAIHMKRVCDNCWNELSNKNLGGKYYEKR